MSPHSLLQRAKNLLFQPELEWEVIRQEYLSSKAIRWEFTNPMVLLTGASALLSGLLFHTGYGFNFSYILSIIFISLFVTWTVVFVSARILTEIAHNFGSRRDPAACYALVSYSSVAFFLSYACANLLNIPPLNSLLSLCGLYTLYIFRAGLEPMLGTPPQARLRFTLVSGLVMLGVYFAIRLLLEAVFAGPLSGI